MLGGVRVVSVALNVPGPVAAADLRDMGASITKIEPPSGDPFEEMCPAWYADLVRGIDVRRVDLRSDDGRARLDALLTGADLLLTSSRPESLARLGLSQADLEVRHPRLRQVAIVGYGGSRRHVAGHDLTYQAHEGLVTPPSLPRSLVADLAGAQQVVIAALGLLLSRGQPGAARFAEVSLAESARRFAAPLRYRLTSADGRLGGQAADYNLYEAQGGWVALAALEPRFKAAVHDVLGVNVDGREGVARVLKTRTAAEWEVFGEQHDLPLVAVANAVAPG